MAQKFNCDLCFTDIPIVENIQKIEIGGKKIVDACLTCAQQITNVIKAQVAEAAKKVAEAQLQAAPAPAAPPAEAQAESVKPATLPDETKPANEGPAPAGQK